MKVQVVPTVEQCMGCAHCPEEDAPPDEACISCTNNPENVGEIVQFLMNDGTAYAVVIIDKEFWLVDINDIRLIDE